MLNTTIFCMYYYCHPRDLHSFPTRRSSDLARNSRKTFPATDPMIGAVIIPLIHFSNVPAGLETAVGSLIENDPIFHSGRSEEHTSELQSLRHLVCRLLLEKKKTIYSQRIFS